MFSAEPPSETAKPMQYGWRKDRKADLKVEGSWLGGVLELGLLTTNFVVGVELRLKLARDGPITCLNLQKEFNSGRHGPKFVEGVYVHRGVHRRWVWPSASCCPWSLA